MRILALGDVVSDYGCSFIRSKLPGIKRFFDIDLCVLNGENSAPGNGITPESADYLISSGIDVITTGNHCFRRKEIYSYMDDHDFILRPCNYPDSSPGRGVVVYDMGRVQVGIINLMGTMFMEPLENPFFSVEKALKTIDGCKIIIVDFHAEATSEKVAMAHYLDGRVSAVFGTHTHVQTADERILENGTGFITDLGMCGVVNSVIGVKASLAIEKFTKQMPVRFDSENKGIRMINGCVFDINEHSGKCEKTERINIS